MYDTSRPYRP